jgi:hypothetical protein
VHPALLPPCPARAPPHNSPTHIKLHAGLFSYNIDSHHVQRVVGEEGALKGWAMNEGDFELYGGPLGTSPVLVLIP